MSIQMPFADLAIPSTTRRSLNRSLRAEVVILPRRLSGQRPEGERTRTLPPATEVLAERTVVRDRGQIAIPAERLDEHPDAVRGARDTKHDEEELEPILARGGRHPSASFIRSASRGRTLSLPDALPICAG